MKHRPAHPAWCAHQHTNGEHRSARLVVELPHREAVGLVLVVDDVAPSEPWAEMVSYYLDWPTLDVTDPAALGVIVLPASHLARLAGALSELATLAAGGSR